MDKCCEDSCSEDGIKSCYGVEICCGDGDRQLRPDN